MAKIGKKLFILSITLFLSCSDELERIHKFPDQNGEVSSSNTEEPSSSSDSLSSSSLATSSSSFSATGDLWRPNTTDFPYLQVKVPKVIECNHEYECSKYEGGWWYGYKMEEATTEIFRNEEYIDFGTDVTLTDEKGNSLIGDALKVKLMAGPTDKKEEPTIAGIGFDYKHDGEVENISNKEGYCITYTSTGQI